MNACLILIFGPIRLSGDGEFLMLSSTQYKVFSLAKKERRAGSQLASHQLRLILAEFC